MIKKLPTPRPKPKTMTDNQKKRLFNVMLSNLSQKERSAYLDKAIKKVYPKSFSKPKVKKKNNGNGKK
jgi:hypothetical protein|tara:strand:- start:834 stop:1037 length:204 start_codon:yes stop_codon:yes gene_type:complete